MPYINDFLEVISYCFSFCVDYFDLFLSEYYVYFLPFVIALGAFLVYEVIHLILKQVYT